MAFTSTPFPFGFIIDIDLSKEHINKEIEVHAVVLAVLHCDGTATIRLDKITSVALNLLRIGSMNFGKNPIRRLYLNNSAQAGKTAQILVTELSDITIQAASIAGIVTLVDPLNIEYDAREPNLEITEIESEDIRDTSPHTSSIISGSLKRLFNFVFVSTLDDAVSIQLQSTPDGTTWINIGPATAVAAGATDYQTISDPWKQFKCVSTCAIAPTSGTLKIQVIRRT